MSKSINVDRGNNALIPPKLYLLTNDDEFKLLYKKLNIALASGLVSRLQVRRKALRGQSESLCYEIEQLCQLTDRYGCELIINDNLLLADKFKLGVHLGQADGDIDAARALLGDEAIIGRTCYDSLTLVAKAAMHGVSYCSMGAVFASTTKPNAKTVPYHTLKQGAAFCQKFNIKYCMIGGITTDNLAKINGIAVDYIAVVNDILGEDVDQIEKKCTQWRTALEQWV